MISDQKTAHSPGASKGLTGGGWMKVMAGEADTVEAKGILLDITNGDGQTGSDIISTNTNHDEDQGMTHSITSHDFIVRGYSMASLPE